LLRPSNAAIGRVEAEMLEALWTIQPQTSARKSSIGIESSVKRGAVWDCVYIKEPL
jgi:hypothetical protein